MKKYSLLLIIVFYSICDIHAQPKYSGTQKQLQLTVNFSKGHQTIRNFGSSTGMRAGYLAQHWPKKVLDKMAKWVFSREVDSAGNPLGIGLSSFRFEMGAGTAYHKKSGISRVWRKSESFLQADGTYDWSQSSGVTYWMQQAKKYNVPTLIGYSNSPPTYYTKNSYGYKLKRSMDANLKADRYDDYGNFLATVAAHFQQQGLKFDYISPVNEPQWAWTGTQNKAKQEGSPWTNTQIKKVAIETNKAFARKGVSTKILISEAARLDFLYKKKPDDFASKASDQINAFWNAKSSNYIGNLSHLAPVAGGHSYWLDTSDSMIVHSRRQLHQRIKEVDPNLEFWQTEYSLLGNGYREKRKNVTEMDAALFIAKIIHYDLTQADASAWQFWATFNGGPKSCRPQRYTLVNAHNPDDVRPTKNLWILGQYSRFVRPGMQRLSVERSDSLSAVALGQKLMASAFYNKKSGKLAVVIINYEQQGKNIRLKLKNAIRLTETNHLSNIKLQPYVTTGKDGESLKHRKPVRLEQSIRLPARSVTTFTTTLKKSTKK